MVINAERRYAMKNRMVDLECKQLDDTQGQLVGGQNLNNQRYGVYPVIYKGCTHYLCVFCPSSADLGLHLCYLDRQLAVERVSPRLDRHVPEADADLRILRVATVRRRAQRVVGVRRQDEGVTPVDESRQIRSPRR